jgi:hypothetical protein
MKITSITEDRIGILIMIDNEVEYSIPKTVYSNQIQNMSEWILDLMDKRWADKDSLYRVGRILIQNTIGSKIDWKKTFHVVEKMDFIRDFASEIPMQPKYTVNGIRVFSQQEINKRRFLHEQIADEIDNEEYNTMLQNEVLKNFERFKLAV